MRQLYVNGVETDCSPLKEISDKCYAMEKGDVEGMNVAVGIT
jgi:hypothetical protein